MGCFGLPQAFSACRAVTLEDARDGCPPDPKKIIMTPHANWGHASVPQPMRVLVDSDWDTVHLLNYVDEVLGRFDGCGAFDWAPQVSIAVTSTVSTFNEKLQADL